MRQHLFKFRDESLLLEVRSYRNCMLLNKLLAYVGLRTALPHIDEGLSF